MPKKQLTPEEIERKKDVLNLRPNIEFVSMNLQYFEKGLQSILGIEPDSESKVWAKGIKFRGIGKIVLPQVTPRDIRKLLSRLPKSLIQLSKLEIVTYLLFGNKRVLPVPGFDQYGNFDSSKVELVPVAEFPRPNDHPSRILVGSSNGTEIRPTPIPKSVSQDERAIYFYQVHVFLHEFFHTIDYPRRDLELRSKIILETDGEHFTLQEWWHEFEQLILSKREPHCVSSYAATYLHELNKRTFKKNHQTFTRALAEQICESFVAYLLGIISNDDGWTDFQRESFGNKKQQKLFSEGKSLAANEKWFLIDKLCRAKVLQKD